MTDQLFIPQPYAHLVTHGILPLWKSPEPDVFKIGERVEVYAPASIDATYVGHKWDTYYYMGRPWMFEVNQARRHAELWVSDVVGPGGYEIDAGTHLPWAQVVGSVEVVAKLPVMMNGDFLDGPCLHFESWSSHRAGLGYPSWVVFHSLKESGTDVDELIGLLPKPPDRGEEWLVLGNSEAADIPDPS